MYAKRLFSERNFDNGHGIRISKKEHFIQHLHALLKSLFTKMNRSFFDWGLIQNDRKMTYFFICEEKRVTFFEFTILTDKQLKRLLEINYPQFTHNALRYHSHELLDILSKLQHCIIAEYSFRYFIQLYQLFMLFIHLFQCAYGRSSLEH